MNWEEDETVEYKHYHFFINNSDRPFENKQHDMDTLQKLYCGFLNNKGGRVYIGVNDSRKVEGVFLSFKQKDLLRNELTNLACNFYPKCRTDKIKVFMIPVKKQDHFVPHLYVIKVIVRKGDSGKLYSICDRSFVSFIRLQGQCVKLNCSEIEKEIIERIKLHKSQESEKPEPIRWEDPEPESFFPDTDLFLNNHRRSNSSHFTRSRSYSSNNNYRFKNHSTDSNSYTRESQSNSNKFNLHLSENDEESIISEEKKKSIFIKENQETSPNNFTCLNNFPTNSDKDPKIFSTSNFQNKPLNNTERENTNIYPTYNYEEKKKKIKNKENLESPRSSKSLKRSLHTESILVQISNFPDDFSYDDLYKFIHENNIKIDSTYKLYIYKNENESTSKTKCANFKVVDFKEYTRLEDLANNMKFRNRELKLKWSFKL